MNRFAGRDVLLNGVHALGGEERVEQFAVAEVVGRIDAQGDERPDVAELHDALGREELGVAEHLVHCAAPGGYGEAVDRTEEPAVFDPSLVARLRVGHVEQGIERPIVLGPVPGLGQSRSRFLPCCLLRHGILHRVSWDLGRKRLFPTLASAEAPCPRKPFGLPSPAHSGME